MEDFLTTISLRRMQVFMTVCKTLHMARAAERLGVSQPALSQQIRGLEQAMGVQLFYRRKRGIDLTAAGETCRIEAERLLQLHAGAVDAIRRAARGESGRITLGYVSSAMFEQRFSTQLKTMREKLPEVELNLREGSIAALLAGLESGDIDIALVRAPMRVEAPLSHRFHSRQDLIVILPKGHHLATAGEAISIARLAAEQMVGFPDADNVGIMRTAADLATAAGVQLQVKWQVSEVGSVLGLVAAGLGYGIVPKAIAQLASPDVSTHALAEPGARTELWLVWHEERMSPALRQFIDIAAPDAAAIRA